MAFHHCHNGNHEFWRGIPGKPPKNCPEHGGPKPKGDTVPPVDINAAVDTLPADIDTAEVITDDDGKPNMFPGDCHYCHRHIDKEGGYRFKVDGKWKVRHSSCGSLSQIANQQGTNANGEGVNVPTNVVTANPVDPFIVRREVDRAITAFVNDKLPPILDMALKTAEVVRHEFVINGEVVAIEGTTNKAFAKLMTMVTAGVPGKRLNIAMPGPAGSGKSYMAVQVAKAIGANIGIISFGPLTNTSKLFGYMDANGNYVRTPFREIWEFGGIMLLDEMDNAHPGLLAELNQALAGDIAAFADGMIPRHPEFRAIATMNTFGKGPDRLYSGRNQLDAATLNRFVTLEVQYDETLETAMAMAFAKPETEMVIGRWIRYVQAVRQKASDAKLALVFSPRNTEQGAMLLSNGMEWDDVVEACMMASVSTEQRQRLTVSV